MGKKIKAEMDEQQQIFVTGAVKNGLSEQLASDVFDQIAAFAGYGFNKSHAAAYALVAYQTAYLKANYPTEFLAASMALDAGNTDKLAVFRQECQRQTIQVLPPDINRSLASFSVETNGNQPHGAPEDPLGPTAPLAIRYALVRSVMLVLKRWTALTKIRTEGGPFLSLKDF